MDWDLAIRQQANNQLFAAAWRVGQRARARVADMTQHFFEELVTVGVGVDGVPNLGEYTPTWQPLSESWAERKGHENFYFDTGNLEYTLLRKSTFGIFGRPQVFLEWNGGVRKINANEPAQKFDGVTLTKLNVIVVPFPKLQNVDSAEELVAGGDESKTFQKLTNPRGQDLRPLVSPFARWYMFVKIKNAMPGMVR